MSTCIAVERLAAAASGEDAAAAAHAAACVACATMLGEQRDVLAAVRGLHAPVLASRAELAAEFAARLDTVEAGRIWRSASAVDDEPRRSKRWPVIAIGAVLAAAAAIIVLVHADSSPSVARGGESRTATSAGPVAPVTSLVPATPITPATPVAPPLPIAVPIAPIAPIDVPDHRAAPRAPHAVAPAPPAAAPVDPAADSMAAFRAGWQALRAGRNADAIAAFDRATDPVVVEDATFWAAIAADRAGDHADAMRRLRDFLEQYPQSPHVDAARAALQARHP